MFNLSSLNATDSLCLEIYWSLMIHSEFKWSIAILSFLSFEEYIISYHLKLWQIWPQCVTQMGSPRSKKNRFRKGLYAIYVFFDRQQKFNNALKYCDRHFSDEVGSRWGGVWECRVEGDLKWFGWMRKISHFYRVIIGALSWRGYNNHLQYIVISL